MRCHFTLLRMANIKKSTGDIPVVQWLELCIFTAKPQVHSLVKELRSHKSHKVGEEATKMECWRGRGEKGTLLCRWWECKLQPLWRTVWRCL